MNKRYLFVSYARADLDRVRPLTDAVKRELEFRALPVDLWMDVNDLQPGENWDRAIGDALKSSIGFLFFISRDSLQSNFVRRELEVAATSIDRLIIPVLLDEPIDVPPLLAVYQWLDYARPTPNDTEDVAAKIVRATESYLQRTPKPVAPVRKAQVPTLAADIAQQVRTSIEPAASTISRNSVFVVHGHDSKALEQLEEYLTSIGVTPIVLSRQDESPQSLFQKFMSVAAHARFAIVLLSADDYGASRKQYEAQGVADRALQFRARQNVILELGFFYGKLGWENVFVVHQTAEQVFPNFERPSDLDGVVFDSLADARWRKKLGARLSAAGFELVNSA